MVLVSGSHGREVTDGKLEEWATNSPIEVANQRHGTLTSRAGVEITSDAGTICAEATRMGGLGIAVAMFGQQFHGSVRNFKQLRARSGKS
jgi:hypothetical protein